MLFPQTVSATECAGTSLYGLTHLLCDDECYSPLGSHKKVSTFSCRDNYTLTNAGQGFSKAWDEAPASPYVQETRQHRRRKICKMLSICNRREFLRSRERR